MGDKMLVSLFGSLTWGPYLSLVPYTFPSTTKHQPKLRRESLPSKQFNKYILLITTWLIHCGVEVSPYICVMDNKQLTKLIRKTIGKRQFPFTFDNIEATMRFISVIETGGDWGTINIEITIVKDSPRFERMSNSHWYSKSAITRQRNSRLYWEFTKSELYTILKFFGLESTRPNKVTYKFK